MKTRAHPIKEPRSKTKQLLFAIAEYMGDNLRDLIDLSIAQLSPHDRKLLMHGGVDRVREQWAREERRSQQMLLVKLRERQWIEERKVGKRILVTLTERGRAIILQERMRAAPVCMKDECIIVIFDIPEQERNIRQQFRYFLRQCNFVQLQKSVWMHGCDVLAALRDFIKDTRSEHWIQVFRAHDVTRKITK